MLDIILMSLAQRSTEPDCYEKLISKGKIIELAMTISSAYSLTYLLPRSSNDRQLLISQRNF